MPVVDPESVESAKLREFDPVLVEQDMAQLREWLASQSHLPQIKDQKLLLFLHSCFYNIPATKSCIETHYRLRLAYPDYFTKKDITSPQLKQAHEMCYNAVMPVPDPEGFWIVYFGLRDTNSSRFLYMEANKASLMTVDGCLAQHGVMPGIIIIQDCKGAGFGHLMKCSLAVLRKFTEYNQDANPVRVKSFHIINMVSWVDKIMYFIKPFVKKEVLELIHFHTNLESLYKHIPKGCLPKELGGDLGPLEEHHVENWKHLESLRDFFAAEDELDANIGKKEIPRSTTPQDEGSSSLERQPSLGEDSKDVDKSKDVPSD